MESEGKATPVINEKKSPFFQSLRFRYGLCLAFFLVIGGLFLWEEHSAHILDYSTLIFVLGGCILMHRFMHHGHSKGHGHHQTKEINQAIPPNDEKKEPNE